MTQFHEGQEVNVIRPGKKQHGTSAGCWVKAKIVSTATDHPKGTFMVQFLDATRAVFAADHIRTIESKLDRIARVDNDGWKA